MSNLACIGIVVDDEAGLAAAMEPIMAEVSPGSGTTRYWRDPSGATLAFHGAKAVDCLTPFFRAPEPSFLSVVSREPVLDTGCRYCSGVDVDVMHGEELVTRTAVQLVEFEPYAAWLGEERRWQLELVAFVRHMAYFADAEAMHASGALGGLRLAENGFLPAGLFEASGELGERAEVVFAGRVAAVEVRSNRTGGGRFVHLVVDTLPGRINVVAPVDEVEHAVGGLVLIKAWLVGCPGEPPPARKKFLGVF